MPSNESQLKEAIDKQTELFGEFKRTNEEALKTNRAESKAALDKIEAKMQETEKKINDLNTAIARTSQSQQDVEKSAEEKKIKEHSEKYAKGFDSYLRKGNEEGLDEVLAEAKTMSNNSDEDGGYLVRPELSDKIVEKIFESTPMRQLADVQTIGSDQLEVLEDLEEIESGWVGEMGTRGNTGTAKLKVVKIPVHELYCAPLATQRQLDDAVWNIEAFLEKKAVAKFGRDEATGFVTGDGVMKPKGILSYEAGTGFNQIEQVNSTSVGVLAGDDIFSLEGALKADYRKNASLLTNRLAMAALRKLKDSQGRYLWEPALNGKGVAMIGGYPIYIGEDMPAVANNNLPVAFGDFKQGYQIVDRIGIRVLRDPFTKKPFVEFYMTKRVGGGVINFEAIKLLKIKAS